MARVNDGEVISRSRSARINDRPVVGYSQVALSGDFELSTHSIMTTN